MREKELYELYQKIEEPLIDVLADMEFEGVRISGEFLNEYSKELAVSIAEIEKTIYKNFLSYISNSKILTINNSKSINKSII